MRRIIVVAACLVLVSGCLSQGSKTQPLTKAEVQEVAASDLLPATKKKLLGNEVVLVKDRGLDAKIDKGLAWSDELTTLLSVLGVGVAGAAGVAIRRVRKKRAAERATAE